MKCYLLTRSFLFKALVLCFLSGSLSVLAQVDLLKWSFNGNSSTATEYSSTVNDESVLSSTLFMTGVTADAETDAFIAHNWPSDNKGITTYDQKYFSFDVTLLKDVSFSSLDFNIIRDNQKQSPQNFKWTFQVGTGAEQDIQEITDFTSTAVTAFRFNLTTIEELQNLSNGVSVTFRFYATNAGAADKTIGLGSDDTTNDFSLVLTGFVNPLEAGDIVFIGFQSDDPDKFAFIALADIPEGTEINFTDKGWLAAGGLRSYEGTLNWLAPVGGLSFGDTVIVSSVSGMSLANDGDEILAYTGDASDPKFIAAIHWGPTTWGDATSANTTALPEGLIDGFTAVSVGDMENGYFEGTLEGTNKDLWLAEINDSLNWTTSNTPIATQSLEVDTAAIVTIGDNMVLNNDVTIAYGDTIQLLNTSSINMNGYTLTNNGTIIIEADVENSGALLVDNYDASSTGSVIIKRGVLSGRWQFVGPGVEGQNILSFLQDETNAIPMSNDSTYYAMKTYDNTDSKWNDYTHVVDLDGSEEFSITEGVAFWKTADGVLQFEGTPVAKDTAVYLSTMDWGWNFIANPYTCPIQIGSDGSEVANFLDVNSSKLVSTNQAVYVWDGIERAYKAYNNASEQKAIVMNQSFMVRATSGVDSVHFTQAMKTINNSLTLKSTTSDWSYLTINVTSGANQSTSTLAFNEEMSPGLDASYDAGVLESDYLQVYSVLEQENLNCDIQALPSSGMEGNEIPLGIKAPMAGQATLSFGMDMNCPYEVYLVDKSTDSKELLTNETSALVDLNQGYNEGRYTLYFYNIALGSSGNMDTQVNITARYQTSQLKLYGLDENCEAAIYDISGRMLALSKVSETDPQISIHLNSGIYLVSLRGEAFNKSLKVRVK